MNDLVKKMLRVRLALTASQMGMIALDGRFGIKGQKELADWAHFGKGRVDDFRSYIRLAHKQEYDFPIEEYSLIPPPKLWVKVTRESINHISTLPIYRGELPLDKEPQTDCEVAEALDHAISLGGIDDDTMYEWFEENERLWRRFHA